MKRIQYFLLLTIIFAGCSKEWLEVEPQNNLTSSLFYKTEDDAVSAITAAYDPLKGNGFFGVDFQLLFYAMDDRVIFENPNYENILFHSNDPMVSSMYMYIYRGLYRVNMALEKIPDIDMDPVLKDRLIGEASFLRAFYNFYLRIVFNDPPLVTKVISSIDEGVLPNSPPEAFWAQIEEDLQKAIEVLPETYDNANIGRATKGAAEALLGKAYLYQQKWADAKKYLGDVISSGVYHLSMPRGNDSIDYVNAYLCNFTSQPRPAGDGGTYDAENNPESIFEIQNNNDPTYWNYYIPGYGSNGSLLSAYFSANGWRNIAPTAKFADQFEKAPTDHPAHLVYDPRRYASLFSIGDTVEYRPGYQWYNMGFDPKVHANPLIAQGYGVRKYYFPLYADTPEAPYNDPNNWRVIRYADVLLMYAEAEFHLNGSSQEALDAINQVRTRAGMPLLTEVTPEAIMHERDVELGLECDRFHDLVRWSLLPDPWVNPENMITGYQKGKTEYLPIPIDEITKSKGLLKQNPGW